MNVQLLIDSIVRQTTVLIAQLATAGGIRAPLSHVANQVFLHLSAELEHQGVSRKVSADMFGMALRAYISKIQRLKESSTDRGRSLWQAIFEFIAENPGVVREDVLVRFHRDDPVLVRSILRDLKDSRLLAVDASGTGYRATATSELREALDPDTGTGIDEFAWVIIYRLGPVDVATLAAQMGASEEALPAVLLRLLDAGRVQRDGDGRYRASEFIVSREAEEGWEAALFDHYHALVKTICCRLQASPGPPLPPGSIGGSTYTFDVWPGHPLYEEVIGGLGRFRDAQSALRERVEAYNRDHGMPPCSQQVVSYAGQCAVEQGKDPTS